MNSLELVKLFRRAVIPVLLGAAALTSCRGTPTQTERIARQDLKTVGTAYRPQNQRPPLPTLETNSGLGSFLSFAILNQPQIEAAYFEWAASVERITRERSLPDPRLTFESDISDVVMTLMPGLMMDFPGPGGSTAARWHLSNCRIPHERHRRERQGVERGFLL